MRRDPTRRVILFTRFPEPGRCKTRLIPMLGRINAAELQRRMTAHAIDVARRHGQTDRLCDLEVRYFGGSASEMAVLYGKLLYREQAPGSLGLKMFQAIDQALSEGIDEVLIMGCDCVGVSPELIERGFNALRGADVVMGPALDGGYYLIGVKQRGKSGVGQGVADLFPLDMPWGSGSVLKKTLDIADRLGMTYRLIDSLPDLDTPEGLPRIQGGPFLNDMPRPVISVIIPTLNEAENISETIRCAQANSVEIIVSDGGSRDATRQTARRQGARVICVEGGRGAQQNEGAKQARGQILLFLHGDTRLPKHFSRDILTLLADPGASAGAFRLGISGSRRAFALVEFFTHLRSVFFQLPYGDQGLFMQKDMFNGVNGFLNIPIMEDYALVLALKKKGRVLIAPSAVATSGRRWEKMGCLKTLVINQLMILGYHLNVKPKTLEKMYKRNTARHKDKKTSPRINARKKAMTRKKESFVLGGKRMEAIWRGPSPKEAPTLIFLHEGLGCAKMWRDFPARLAEATRCGALAYSRWGYGGSDPCALPRPIHFMHDEGLEVLPELIRLAGIRECILIGHSDGGSIAIIYAGGVAASALGVITEAAHLFCEEKTVRSIEKTSGMFRQGDFRRKLAKYHGDNVDVAFWGWNRVWRHPDFMTWNIEEYLPGIRVPMLAIQGENDEYGSPAQVESIVNGAGGEVETALFEDCGHDPLRDQPERSFQVMKEFILRVVETSSRM